MKSFIELLLNPQSPIETLWSISTSLVTLCVFLVLLYWLLKDNLQYKDKKYLERYTREPKLDPKDFGFIDTPEGGYWSGGKGEEEYYIALGRWEYRNGENYE